VVDSQIEPSIITPSPHHLGRAAREAFPGSAWERVINHGR